MKKLGRILALCVLLLAFDTTIAGLIAAADKDHAGTGTYCIVRDSSGGNG
mgnify:CR=1 FL=1